MADNQLPRSSNLGRSLRSQAGPSLSSEAGEFALGTQAGAPEAAESPETVAESQAPTGYGPQDPYLKLAQERRKKEAAQGYLTGGAAPAAEEPQDISERLRQRQLELRQIKQQLAIAKTQLISKATQTQETEEEKKKDLLKPQISDIIIKMLGFMDTPLKLIVAIPVIGWILGLVLIGPFILLLDIFILLIRMMQAPGKFKNYIKTLPISFFSGAAGAIATDVLNQVDARKGGSK